MDAALRLLLLSISISLANLLFDKPIVSGLVAGAQAVGLAAIALALPPGEAGHLQRIFRPAAAVLAVPAVWMVIQILPLKFVGLAHPIWASAGEALGRPIGGGISIDPGATLVALGQYLSAAAGVFLATAVAIDRQRAKALLIGLTGTTTLIAVVATIQGIAKPALIGHLAGDAALAGSVLGTILAAAMAIQQFDLDVSGRGKREAVGAKHMVARIASLAALATCVIALITSARSDAMFAAACGLTALGALVVICRFNIGRWGCSAIAATALVGAAAIIGIRYDLRHAALTLASVASGPRPLVEITQRISGDAGWAGTGADTFAALVPIYRDIDDAIADPFAPTAAAAIAIEMGRPFLVLAVIGALASVTALLRGALRRGRDACYPAAGAACLVALVLLAFSQAGAFNTAVATIAAAASGLALAQSHSRTARS